MSVLLASKSPQRSALLDQLGISFRVLSPDTNELSMGDTSDIVLKNAHAKANSVKEDVSDRELVIACDTLVDVDGIPFGKPETKEDAFTMLALLRGRVHDVVGGLVIANVDSDITRERVVRTKVRFRNFTDEMLNAYLDTDEWRGRAGGYAIQGRGAGFVSGIGGCYFNVVGLPIAALFDEVDDEDGWSSLLHDVHIDVL